MLTLYLANGIITGAAPSAGTVITPPERTIILTRSGSRFRAEQDLDPSDIVDYLIDVSSMLGANEGVAEIKITLRPSASDIGFRIMQSEPYEPVEIDSSHVQIWVSIDIEMRGNDLWSALQSCAFDVDVTTDSTPTRHFQRTCLIGVIQK